MSDALGFVSNHRPRFAFVSAEYCLGIGAEGCRMFLPPCIMAVNKMCLSQCENISSKGANIHGGKYQNSVLCLKSS